jgi:hypothetical protein
MRQQTARAPEPATAGSVIEEPVDGPASAELSRLTAICRDFKRELDEARRREDRFRLFADKDLPIYVGRDLEPLLTNEAPVSMHRGLVIALPKAGNYLISALLRAAGMRWTGMAISMNGLGDRRFVSESGFRGGDRTKAIDIPFQQAIGLIGAGQFAYGPIECSWRTRHLLKPYKVVFAKRNLRDVLTSHMRWLSATHGGTDKSAQWKNQEDSSAKLVAYLEDVGVSLLTSRCYPLMDWSRDPDSFHIRFEDISGDYGRESQLACIGGLFAHFGLDEAVPRTAEIIDLVLNKPTLTWSGRRSNWQSVWSPEAERIFQSVGGPSLNSFLGFAENAADVGASKADV